MSHVSPSQTSSLAGSPTSASQKRKRASTAASVPSSRVAGTYERRRAPNACLVCRARKTKCDNELPICGFCRTTGGECQYSTSSSSRFDQASLTILNRLNEIETLIKTHDERIPHYIPDYHTATHQVPLINSQSEPPFINGASHPDRPSVTTSPSEGFHSAQNSHARQSYNSGQPSLALNSTTANLQGETIDGHGSRFSTDVPPSSAALLKASEMTIESVLQWPILKNRISELELSVSTPLMEVMGRLVSNDIGQPLAGNIDPRLQNGTVSRLNIGTVEILIENFLLNNHIVNPVLDPELLRRDGRECAEKGLQWDGKSCLILLVLAIGSISTSLSDCPRRGRVSSPRYHPSFHAAEAYFEASQRRIGSLYHENSLIATQCAFLTGVYLMYTMRILAAWKSFVQAGTQCLGYMATKGLMNIGAEEPIERTITNFGEEETADPSKSSRLRVLEDGLYWSCLKSELELRLELSLPGSGINESHYPHMFPSPPSFEELVQSSRIPREGIIASPGSLSADDREHLETGWFFYLGEIALKRLTNRILLHRYERRSTINDYNSELEKDAELERSISEFDLQLQQWMRSLPPPMRFPEDPSLPVGDILRWVLRGHMIDIIEFIRFPAIRFFLDSSPRQSSSGISSSLISATTLRVAREYLENAVDRIEVNAEGFLHRHQGTWLMIRSCTRSALVILAVAFKCRDDAIAKGQAGFAYGILPEKWRPAVVKVLDMLDMWKGESADVERLYEVVGGLWQLFSD